MRKGQKFDIKYDYSVSMLCSEKTETLIGGSEKVLKRALKDGKNLNLAVKDLDIYYRDLPLGTFALNIYHAPDVEVIQKLVDKLYANLIDKKPTGTKVADTKLSLNSLFSNSKNSVVIRVLARISLVWYVACTDYYMNGKFGIPIPQKERSKLGEQFREEVDALIEKTYTTLKKKKSPLNNTEIPQIIKYNCAEIEEFLAEYLRNLTSNKVFCIRCKLCDNYFLAHSRNAQYCADCKVLRKKNSKRIYAEKCSEGVHYTRQQIKYRFENYIHKGKVWSKLSYEERAEYQALREEFVSKSAAMLREYDKNGGVDLENDIRQFLKEMEGRRIEFEFRLRG